ncbi:MAG: DUF5677 domain-containing protein [Brevundimonas sp.]|uniref:DUF5677 domain-containing protein n=1 Tax=Brevundimonas sp. TaxID=1871086 RepID=UPI0039192526
MQAALEASARRLPELQLQKILARRAEASGIKLHPHETEALAKHLLAGGKGPITLDERPGLTEAKLTFTAEDAAEIRGLPDQIEAAMSGAVEGVVKKSADVLLRSIRKRWPAIKAEHDKDRVAFLETIQLLWGDALDKLDMLIATAESVGGQAIAVARASRSKKRVAVTTALDRLHIRGIQVANEILALLREGFADAAFSRWRTLHEISVVAIVLGDHGEALAIRYLDHDLVEAQRGAEVYQRCHPKDAAKRKNAAALKQTLADYNEVVARYGPAFKSPYGWAAEALGKEKPSFQHLEEAADQAQMRLRYKAASYGVHAGTKGLTVSVADVFGEGPPGAASIAGLHEAGAETAYSLVRLTGPLLGPNWSVDKLAGMNVLIRLRDAASRAFSRGGQAMHDATWMTEEQFEAWTRQADDERPELGGKG